MKMRKTVLLIVFGMCITVMSGCGCKHTFQTKTTKATCKNYGIIQYTCTKCGLQYEDYIPCTENHSFNEKVLLKATCGTKGLTVYSCSICDYSYSKETQETGAHKYTSSVTKEATCQDGERTFRCTVCGDSYKEKIDARNPHKYESKVTKAATCSALGEITKTCTICGMTEKEMVEKNPNNHTFVATVTKAASCTEEGKRTQKCSGCGYSIEETLPKTDHVWSEGDCETARTCTICGETKPAGSHYFTVPVTGDLTTACTNEQICKNCGKKAPPLGHDLSTEVFTMGNYKGSKAVCSRCHSIMASYSAINPLPYSISTNLGVDMRITDATGIWERQENGKLSLTVTYTANIVYAKPNQSNLVTCQIALATENNSNTLGVRYCVFSDLHTGDVATASIKFTDLDESAVMYVVALRKI